MTEIRIQDWVLDCDVEATREAYKQIAVGGPEACGCLDCRNFAAARSLAYPQAALSIYEQLGVTPSRETEVYEAGPKESDLVRYGGWHHFIGKVRKDPGTMLELTKTFSICFNEGRACAAPVFTDRPLVQAEFFTRVPWVLAEKPPPVV